MIWESRTNVLNKCVLFIENVVHFVQEKIVLYGRLENLWRKRRIRLRYVHQQRNT